MGIWKFVGIQDNYPKIVVTMDEIEGVSYQGIKPYPSVFTLLEIIFLLKKKERKIKGEAKHH